MKPKNLALSLNENERKILIALRKLREATTNDLKSATGLSKDAVEKACSWAETKGVISVHEEVSKEYDLTGEGQTYAENGLPEKLLLRKIQEGENEIRKLKESFTLLDIALVWIRRNGWAEIAKGKLEITEKGRQALTHETLEEQILSSMKKTPKKESQLDQQAQNGINVLLRRGLIKERETATRLVNITDFGLKVVPHIESLAEIRVVTQLTPDLLHSGEWNNVTLQRYDVNLPAPKIYPGKRHFLSQVIDYIRRFWVEMGFKEMSGPFLELAFWNFDALYQPQDHPARDLADTFYMKTPSKGHLPSSKLVKRVKETHENGWTTGSTGWQYRWDSDLARQCCLRTHTTSLSVNTIARLAEEDLPAKFFSVGRVFRNETIDWNHLMEFYQTDGIVIGEGVSFQNLQGYLKEYLEKMGLKRFRFRPGYFPYTEMSLEAEVWIEEKESWMELFGAGMFRPEVVKPLFGREVPVLAWGPGFDRIVMRHYGINNLKQLYSNDLGQLREATLWVE